MPISPRFPFSGIKRSIAASSYKNEFIQEYYVEVAVNIVTTKIFEFFKVFSLPMVLNLPIFVRALTMDPFHEIA